MQAPANLTLRPSPEASILDENQRMAIHVSGGWVAFVLLTIMILSLAWAVAAAGWAAGLSILQWAALGGVLAGAGLALTRWPGAFGRLYALIVGTAWVIVLTSSLIISDLTMFEKVQYIWHQLYLWTEGALSGKPIANNLVFVLQVAFLSWWLGYLAAWAIFRQGRVWRAVIPVGLAMLVNGYYGPSHLRTYLLIFLVSALLLIVRANLTRQEEEWQETGIRYASDIGVDFLRDGAIFTVLVILMAWVTPTAAAGGQLSPLMRPLERPWETVRQEWGRLFSSLNYQPSSLASAFGRSMTLSGPRTLGNNVVMDIKAPNGNYWRGVTFDTYNGRQWINNDADAIAIGKDEPITAPTYSARRVITQTVTTYLRGESVLFAAPQPIGAEVAGSADVTYIPNQQAGGQPASAGRQPTNEAQPVDISRMRSRQQFKEGSSYQVVSAISTADERSLRQAGVLYPAYVSQRYLQLPEDLSPRIKALAAELTANAANPYDKAVILEQFLRTEIKYNEKIAAPPADVDPIDYVLFVTKEGYCDYYASAMTVMARSLGIPARFVAGYSQGDYEAETGVYRVREANAHSWVEVYFPNYGWIEFEPTAAQPSIVRPAQPSTPTDAEKAAEEAAQKDARDLRSEENKFGEGEDVPGGDLPAGQTLASLPIAGQIGVGIALLAVMAAAIVLLSRRARTRQPAVLPPDMTLRIYERLDRWATRVGLGRRVSQTPYEHTGMLIEALPEGAAPIRRITDLYVQECFSPVAVTARDLQALFADWQSLQPILRRYWSDYQSKLPLQKRVPSLRRRNR